ncbi:MAG TPA: hypothetical protein VHP31_08765 [Caproicibacter sp.]|nr:hypothetical protein [Caproicibacter sp.]
MPLQSRAIHNPNNTPEDDHIKWLRVSEIFQQHYEREEAAKKAAAEEKSKKLA